MAEPTTTTPKSTAPPPSESAPPPSGKAAPKEPEHVESALANVPLKDALGKTPEEIQKEQQEATDEVGAGGVLLPGRGEIAGGNIKKVLDPPPAESLANRPYVKEQAAMMTDVMKKIAPFMGRPPTEWGILGPGDTAKGNMILLDLNTGEKVRAMDGHRFTEGSLFINARNIPESLSTGDTIDRVLGG